MIYPEDMKTKFLDQVMSLLSRYVEEKHDGVVSRAAKALEFKDPSLLNQWLNGTRIPSLSSIAPIMDKLGVTLFEPEPCGSMEKEFAMIRKVQAKAGAGSSLLTSGYVEGLYAFRHQFLARIGVNPDNAVMLDVMGTSMEPLIRDGDTILVDQSDCEPRDNHIFLIGLDEEVMVKWLNKIPGGWSIHSQNPEVKDVAVRGLDLEFFRVYGRVRWFGRVV